jgi:O-antigen/teichoic acid export membrane protein
LLRLGSLAVPFLALQNLASAATRGFKKMEYTVIAQSVSMPVTKLVLMLALAITGLSAAKALSAYMLSVIVGSVMLVYFLNKLFSLGRPVGTAHRETGKMLRFALPLYASDLITTFRGSMQTVLLGALHTVTSVGVFAVVSQVTLVGKMFHSSIAVSSMPIVSELHGRGELKHLERLYQTMTRWTFTLNLPLFLVVLLFPEQILSAFGQDFVGGATALVILAWANLAKTGSGICNALLDMTGRTRLKLMNSAVRSVLLIGLNVLLIPSWGVVGAATAVVVSSVVSSLFALLENFLLLRMLPYNMSFLKPIAAGLAATGVVLALGRVLSPEVSLFHAAVNVFVLLVAYVSVILLLGLTEEDRSVLTRLWGRTGRKVLEYLPSLTALGK